MTRKDYQLIAGAIRKTRKDLRNREADLVLDRLASDLNNALCLDNPNFDSNKFFEAQDPR